jgi:hypothetical protein
VGQVLEAALRKPCGRRITGPSGGVAHPERVRLRPEPSSAPGPWPARTRRLPRPLVGMGRGRGPVRWLVGPRAGEPPRKVPRSCPLPTNPGSGRLHQIARQYGRGASEARMVRAADHRQ